MMKWNYVGKHIVIPLFPSQLTTFVSIGSLCKVIWGRYWWGGITVIVRKCTINCGVKDKVCNSLRFSNYWKSYSYVFCFDLGMKVYFLPNYRIDRAYVYFVSKIIDLETQKKVFIGSNLPSFGLCKFEVLFVIYLPFRSWWWIDDSKTLSRSSELTCEQEKKKEFCEWVIKVHT
jgi:hypothetical protein